MEIYSKIPDDTDILMTHNPPYSIRDLGYCGYGGNRLCETCNQSHPKYMYICISLLFYNIANYSIDYIAQYPPEKLSEIQAIITVLSLCLCYRHCYTYTLTTCHSDRHKGYQTLYDRVKQVQPPLHVFGMLSFPLIYLYVYV